MTPVIVEHSFVLTGDDIAIASTAEAALEREGFQIERNPDGQIVATRGRKKARAHYRIDQLPQRLRLTVDRGRVCLALALESPGKPTRLHDRMLRSLPARLEARLRHGVETVASDEEWTAILMDIETSAAAALRRRRVWIVLTVLAILSTCTVCTLTTPIPE